MKRKGFRIIRLPDNFHVIVHKSFTGTVWDLILNKGSAESADAASSTNRCAPAAEQSKENMNG